MTATEDSASPLVAGRLGVPVWALLGIGALHRVLQAFPTHKFPPDADALVSGLGALEILRGNPQIFLIGTRIGALECYMHVPSMWLLGISRAAVSVAPLLSGILILLFFVLFLRELFGPRLACLALIFVAIPSPSFTWIYLPNGYAETIALCILTLYVAARMEKARFSSAWTFVLGFIAGLGLWQSVQTLTCSVPALIWLVLRRRDLLRRHRFWQLALSGLVAGALPWILFNAVHPFGSFNRNFAVRPALGVRSVISNLSYFVSYDLPELVVGQNPFHIPIGLRTAPQLANVLRFPSAAVYASGFALLLFLAFRPHLGDRLGASGDVRPGVRLLLSVGFGVLLANIVSEAGQTRGYTVRYVLPLFFVAAVAAGAFVSLTWGRAPLVSLVGIATVLTFNLLGFSAPWTAHRHYLRELDRKDHELIDVLQMRGVDWVCGNYWDVYPLSFLTNRRILGVPFQRAFDYHGFSTEVEKRSPNWALVSTDPRTIQNWLAKLPLQGEVQRVATRFSVFLPDETERVRRSRGLLIRQLQNAAPWPP